MAVRVQNAAAINFGNAVAAVTLTHFEVLYGPSGSRSSLGIKQASSPVEVAAGSPMQFAAGELDILFRSGDINDAAMKRMVDSFVSDADEGWQVKAYTSATQEVQDTGYSAQAVPSVGGWTTSTESD